MKQKNKKFFAEPAMLVDPIPEINEPLSGSEDWGFGEMELFDLRKWSLGEQDIE